MACVRLHHRFSVPMAYRFMIATAFVVLMPYTVQAADELPKEAVLPMNMADKAIQASLDACNKDGYRVSVSVVDRAPAPWRESAGAACNTRRRCARRCPCS